ncbi:MAG: hypothetical protein VXZ40_04080, partial [Nanoarchaeota archaeon]|nr:hypothetical protein [Nanoarchaeota archaeon]
MKKNTYLEKSECLQTFKFCEYGISFLYFPMMVIPLDLFSYLEKSIYDFFPKNEILESIGFQQSNFSVNYLRDFHSLQIKKESIHFFFDQIKFFGFGEVLSFKEKGESCQIEFQYSINYPLVKSNFLEGMLLGILYKFFNSYYYISSKENYNQRKVILNCIRCSSTGFISNKKYTKNNLTLLNTKGKMLFDKTLDTNNFIHLIKKDILSSNKKHIVITSGIFLELFSKSSSISHYKTKKLACLYGRTLFQVFQKYIFTIQENKRLEELNNILFICGFGSSKILEIKEKIFIQCNYATLYQLSKNLGLHDISEFIYIIKKEFFK